MRHTLTALAIALLAPAARAQAPDAGVPDAGEPPPLGPEVLEETGDDPLPLGPEVLEETGDDPPPLGPEVLEETGDDPPPLGPEILDETGDDPPPLGPEVLDEPGDAPPPSGPAGDPPAASAPAGEPPVVLDAVSIIGRPEEVARISGSAHAVGPEVLETFEHDDVHRVLEQVPGVYVRGEDGFGLRPNIGLRGANSDRSAKVTLMEDGILLSPAPYSAPAAYYFPLTTRMERVEVFKGPAAIRYGPNTIGGAINLVSRQPPRRTEGAIDLAAGQYRFGKVHGWWGTGDTHWAVLLEGVHLETGGFKDLDGGDGRDTGFDKNEIVARVRLNTDPAGEIYNQLDVKLGYADELSHETYLGLTAADFEASPYRRYAASALGRMEWRRLWAQVGHTLAVGEDLDLHTTVYRHDFERAWRKLNRFAGGPAPGDLLAHPDAGRAQVFYRVLTGQEDSATPDETLMIGTNDRRFVSQGVQLAANWRWESGWFGQRLQVGARFHNDSIERHHFEDGHLMRNGVLVPDGADTLDTTRNFAETFAWAFHLVDEVRIGERWYVTPGARLEIVRTTFEDRLAGREQSNDYQVVLPGIGTWYELFDGFGVLAGVHKGFSPVAPGQPAEVEPEESLNYEAGARYQSERARLELVGFFNDYRNLTGECTLSAGCPEDRLNAQFNGGAVDVYGLEAAGGAVFGPRRLQLRVDLSYTLTLSEFQTSFRSPHPQFGDVEAGDRLAYVPEHQASGRVGVSGRRWGVELAASYVGEMRDVPGRGAIPDEERIPARLVLDLAAHHAVGESGKLYAKIDNLLDEAYIASRRPFGIRPGKPFQAFLGYKHAFGGP